MSIFELSPLEFKIYHWIKYVNSFDANKEGFTLQSLEGIDCQARIYKYQKTSQKGILRSLYSLKQKGFIELIEDKESNDVWLKAKEV